MKIASSIPFSPNFSAQSWKIIPQEKNIQEKFCSKLRRSSWTPKKSQKRAYCNDCESDERKRTETICSFCGKWIYKKHYTQICQTCFTKNKKINWKISKNELALMFIWPFLHAEWRRFDHWKLGRKRYEKIEQTN